MTDAAYLEMNAVEDDFWWYRVLRGQVVRCLDARLPEGAAVLDAGCGTGGMMDLLAERYVVTGVDVSPLALRLTRERGHNRLQEASVEALQFADASFDAVICLDVIVHQGVDDSRALGELARVLKPGGWLVLNAAGMEWLRGSHDASVCGARRYNVLGIRRLIENAGLKVASLHGWNAWLLPALYIRRRLSVGSASSDFWRPPAWLNKMLTLVGHVDAALCRAICCRWGSSIFAVATK